MRGFTLSTIARKKEINDEWRNFDARPLIDFTSKALFLGFCKILSGLRSYLVCAGPFPVNIKIVSTKDSYGEIYNEEEFDESNLSAQTEALLKQMKESLEWRKKYNY